MSEIKVNKISPRTACGTTTLGDSGDTFTIPAGVSITNNGTASGFGATGAASWNTTVKTGDFTAVAGEGYFVNTTSGAVNVTLPSSPSAGAVVAIKDYANTFDTNAVNILRNGSNIGGLAENSILSTEGIAVTLLYIDATKGWLVTDDGLQSSAPGPEFVVATGGTVATCGNFKIHTFTGPGTFTVTSAGNPLGSATVDYLVVGGGGGGGEYYGAGGGAGGARMSSGAASGCYTVGPLGSGVSGLPVPATTYPITVGAGGAGTTSGTPTPGGSGFDGIPGNTSSFSTITSAGGGHGAGSQGPARDGGPGGSGGGGTGGPPAAASDGGSGNTPPVSPPQGQNGGPSVPGCQGGGWGGGATAAGGASNSPNGSGGTRGGTGVANNINGTTGQPCSGSRYYAGGGNSSQISYPNQPLGGLGGGGAGPGSPSPLAVGQANTGGGGGGNAAPGSGGSGVVVIRYKFQ